METNIQQEVSDLEQLPPEMVVEILRPLTTTPEGVETIERFFETSKKLRELRPFFERELEKGKEEYYYPTEARQAYEKSLLKREYHGWMGPIGVLDPKLATFMNLNLPKFQGKTVISLGILMYWWYLYELFYTDHTVGPNGAINSIIPNEDMWKLFGQDYSERINPGESLDTTIQNTILDTYMDETQNIPLTEEIAEALEEEYNYLNDLIRRSSPR